MFHLFQHRLLELVARTVLNANESPGDQSPWVIHVISSALAPVLLVSAAALLGVGISQKHAALGDRIRSLAAERRAPGGEPARRSSVQAQLELFARRIRLASLAHRALYLAICCLLGVILIITLRTPLTAVLSAVSLGLFILGVFILLVAIGLELGELHLANRTIAAELKDAS